MEWGKNGAGMKKAQPARVALLNLKSNH